jgi:hypothetical protein
VRSIAPTQQLLAWRVVVRRSFCSVARADKRISETTTQSIPSCCQISVVTSSFCAFVFQTGRRCLKIWPAAQLCHSPPTYHALLPDESSHPRGLRWDNQRPPSCDRLLRHLQKIHSRRPEPHMSLRDRPVHDGEYVQVVQVRARRPRPGPVQGVHQGRSCLWKSVLPRGGTTKVLKPRYLNGWTRSRQKL